MIPERPWVSPNPLGRKFLLQSLFRWLEVFFGRNRCGAAGAGERVGQGSGKAAPPTAVIDHATGDVPVVRVFWAEEWVKSLRTSVEQCSRMSDFDAIPSRYHQ